MTPISKEAPIVEGENYIWVNTDISKEFSKKLECPACGRNFENEKFAFLLIDILEPDDEPELALHNSCFNKTISKEGVRVSYPANQVSRLVPFNRLWALVLRARALCDELDEGTLSELHTFTENGLIAECDKDPEAELAAKELAKDIFDRLFNAIEDVEIVAENIFDDLIEQISSNTATRYPTTNYDHKPYNHNDRRSHQIGWEDIDDDFVANPHRGRVISYGGKTPHSGGTDTCSECGTVMCCNKWCEDHDHFLVHYAKTGHNFDACVDHDLPREKLVCTS